jgi:UDP-glucose:(heptosyl)LPS alpha-1,3-glucosyltransferase
MLTFILYKYFPFGGLQRDFLRIAQACEARGQRFRVLTMEWAGEKPKGWDIQIAPRHAVRALTQVGKYQRFTRWVEKKLVSSESLVVGFNKMPGLDFYYAADPCFAEKAVTQRGRFYTATPRYRHFKAYEEAVFGPRSHTQILMISATQLPLFQKHYGTPTERFHMLPPGISRDRKAPADAASRRAEFRRAHRIADADVLCLMIASDYQNKGLGRALEAVATANQALKPTRTESMTPAATAVMAPVVVKFFVVGQGESKRFGALAAKLGIADRVTFFPARNDVPEFLLGADLLLHPAIQENTGTVILEALVAGLPVITTANCGYAHYVTKAQCGLVVPLPFDQRALNQAVTEAFRSAEQRQTWSSKAHRYADEADLYDMPIRVAEILEKPLPRQRLEMHADQWLDEPFQTLWSRKDVFAEAMSLQGELFRDMKTRRTLRFHLGGESFFIKLHLGVGWGEIIKNLLSLRLPIIGAKPELNAIAALTAAGVPTMQAVAYACRGTNPARQESFLITRELQQTISLEDYCRNWLKQPPEPRHKRAIIREVAEMTRRMHAAGMNHRDYYLVHFLLHQDALPTIKISLIDLHRAQLRTRVPIRWRNKDLAALAYSANAIGLTQRDRLRFLADYFQKPLREILQNERPLFRFIQKQVAYLEDRWVRRFADKPALQIQTVYRNLPGKRMTALVKDESGLVSVAKIFLGNQGAQSLQKEVSGLRLLQAAGVPTARILRTEESTLFTEHIAGAQPLASLLAPDVYIVGEASLKSTPEELIRLLSLCIRTIARLHQAGLVHDDLHPGNLLIQSGQAPMQDPMAYLLDGDAVQSVGSESPSNPKRSDAPETTKATLENLALFLAQFTPEVDSFFPSLVNLYESVTGFSVNRAELDQAIHRVREKRCADYLSKTLRDCTLFQVQKSFTRFQVSGRSQHNQLQQFFQKPDSLMNGSLLKDGNTCTVTEVNIKATVSDSIRQQNQQHNEQHSEQQNTAGTDASLRTLVIKRYNIKGLGHWLTRFWRPSRAWHSWVAGHRLKFLAIPTAEPVAMMESRFGPLRGRAWLAMAKVDGVSLDQLYPRDFPGDFEDIHAESLAKLLGQLNEHRISHGDMKASNLIWSEERQSFVLIDLDALKHHPLKHHSRPDSFTHAHANDLQRLRANWPAGSKLDEWFDRFSIQTPSAFH